jgi:hypothetical protein
MAGRLMTCTTDHTPEGVTMTAQTETVPPPDWSAASREQEKYTRRISILRIAARFSLSPLPADVLEIANPLINWIESGADHDDQGYRFKAVEVVDGSYRRQSQRPGCRIPEKVLHASQAMYAVIVQ